MNCPYCGVEYKKPGSKNLHEPFCEKNPNKRERKVKEKAKEDIKKEETKEKEVNDSLCPECKNKMRLLSRKNSLEARAIVKGFKEVCPVCKEVR